MMHVAALALYPVKSCHGVPVKSATVEPWGLAGDRRYLVIEESGRFLTQREVPLLATITVRVDPSGLDLSQAGRQPIHIHTPTAASKRLEVTVWRDRVSAVAAAETADRWLSDALGRPCRLVFMDAPDRARPVDPTYAGPDDHVSFADGFPLLVASAASLVDLNERLDEPVAMDRFRPNIVVEGAPAWAEDDWRRLRIGSVVFDSVKPCARCIVTTTDQESGERRADLEPIRTLQRFRRDRSGQVLFGQNLVPRSCGTIRIGDTVETEA